jgi:hypothetical protein
MRNVARIVLFLLLLGLPAQARDRHAVDQRNIEVGDALVCETQEQVESYVAHYSGDREAAIRAVNREEGDPRACGVLSVAFLRGPHIAKASHGDMAFEILPILIVGVNTDSGIQAVSPVIYFTAFGVVEYDV